jgi:diadenosine tetraphosphatase ApaH/serine/threonine PP2A family protein phosphatase
MKLALLSDIHANLQALEACLTHARGQGAKQLALLGDFVGYGGDPTAVMERVMALAEQGAWVVKGNHDEMAVTPPLIIKKLGESSAPWTHAQLSQAQLKFLDGLPLTHHVDSIFLVHASADAPAKWRYVYEHQAAAASLNAALTHPGVRYVFGGHVHTQTLYYLAADGKLMKFEPHAGVAVPVPGHRSWLATIGSVGQPRDANPKAMYALFDTEKALLTFHRIPYDVHAAAAAIRRAGLPAFFADRLEEGR